MNKNEVIKEAEKMLFQTEITRLKNEYGPVRIAKLVDYMVPGVDTLVVFSPVFCDPDDSHLAAVCVLDTRLYHVGEAAYGSIQKAALELGTKKTS